VVASAGPLARYDRGNTGVIHPRNTFKQGRPKRRLGLLQEVQGIRALSEVPAKLVATTSVLCEAKGSPKEQRRS
jgi:hypothetical protein